METDADMVIVTSASSPAIAQAVAGLLETEGIPAYVEGVTLQDPVALSHELMRTSGVNVKVPRSALEKAKRVLAEARAAGRLLAEDQLPESGSSTGA
jgi:hypothetical protein